MSGIPSWARVGAKVVCVDDKFIRGPGNIASGQVYVIEHVFTNVSIAEPQPHLTVLLRGLVNPWAKVTGGYSLRRFRPLVTRTQEQDIEEHFKPLIDNRELVE